MQVVHCKLFIAMVSTNPPFTYHYGVQRILSLLLLLAVVVLLLVVVLCTKYCSTCM